MTWQLLIGNNLDVLPTLESNSVDSIVTDPPYELGFMGKKWDNSGIAYSVELWEECLRVLKPGGHLLSFGGTRTWHRVAVAIEDSGFDVRDSIAWLYGSGFPKSLNLKGEWEGWGTALKPAFEPIVVARKPIEGTVANNVLKWGTGGLNIDGSRIGTETIVNQPGGIPNGANNFVNTDKTRNRDVPPTTAQGRWPANIILDPYTAELLDEQSGVLKSGGLSGQSVYSDSATKTPSSMVQGMSGKTRTYKSESNSGGASRFFYVAKASKRDRNEGLDELEIKRPDTRSSTGMGTFEEKGVQPQRNFHPTVKPTALMEYLIKLVTPPNGVVLDPFTGSGSTGKAAILQGFNFIGIEMTEEYVPIIEGRLKHAEQQASNKLI